MAFAPPVSDRQSLKSPFALRTCGAGATSRSQRRLPRLPVTGVVLVSSPRLPSRRERHTRRAARQVRAAPTRVRPFVVPISGSVPGFIAVDFGQRWSVIVPGACHWLPVAPQSRQWGAINPASPPSWPLVALGGSASATRQSACTPIESLWYNAPSINTTQRGPAGEWRGVSVPGESWRQVSNLPVFASSLRTSWKLVPTKDRTAAPLPTPPLSLARPGQGEMRDSLYVLPAQRIH
jgi:hypothetical protein